MADNLSNSPQYLVMAAPEAQPEVALQNVLARPQQDLQDCLSNILNFTALQITIIINDGIKTWCSDKTKLALNCFGCTYCDLRVKSLQGLAWWCTDHHLHGRNLDLASEFNGTFLVDSREEAKLDYAESKKDAIVDKPKIFDAKKWYDWSESVFNYFNAMKNSRGIPYSYVIRVDPPALTIAQMDRDQEKIYNAQLVGNMFNRDSKFVEQVLKELIVGTDAEHWAKAFREKL